MSQGVRYVLCIQEELNLIPSTHAKSQLQALGRQTHKALGLAGCQPSLLGEPWLSMRVPFYNTGGVL